MPPLTAAAVPQVQYQICVQCVMDTSDPDIRFDASGVCNHCASYEEARGKYFFTGEDARLRLDKVVQTIRSSGRSKPYDSILGLSGGVDSSFVAHWAVKAGLRPLVVHVDAGWNSEIAVQNIERLVKKLKLDLVTHVIRWEEMRDLQLAFLKAGVPNQDAPQDHAYFAVLYQYARQKGIRWMLSGGNYQTESILPKAWGHAAMDGKLLRAIHRRFGERRLEQYKTVSLWQYLVLYPHLHRIRTFCPLNYLDYRKSEAEAFLTAEYGWRPYGPKHAESRFTKFFQGHLLPARFGYDKRRAHLASLVVSGLLGRSEALRALEQPAYDAAELEQDRDFVMKKLGLSRNDFDWILASPLRTHRDYPNDEAFWLKLQWARGWLLRRKWL